MKRLGRLAAVLALALLAGRAAPAAALDDGLARTPPMGWNGWYAFGCAVTERTVRETADAMVRTGMRGAGYRFVNLDDCWMGWARAANGELVPDHARFPHGIAAVARYVHARGLLLGTYLDAGRRTCAGRPGSAGHLEQDARMVARWGTDLVKLDWCYAGGAGPATLAYARMRDALRATGRPILLSICEWGGTQPWTWGPATGHMWRTARDIPHYQPRDRWRAVMRVVARNAELAPYAGPGGWNDPDILQVGLGGLTPTEGRTVFSLWAVMAAPLLAGGDLRHLDRATRATLLNREVIAVDQDPAGLQGRRVSSRRGHDVWVRALASGERVVVLVNRTAHSTRFVVRPAAVTAVPSARFRARDLWAHRTRIVGGRFTQVVAPHGAAMLRLRPLA